jgi:hypothetical protein
MKNNGRSDGAGSQPEGAAGGAPTFSRTRVEQDFLAAFEAFGSPRFFEFVARHADPSVTMICNCPSELLQIGGTHRGLPDVTLALRSFFTEFQVKATAVDDIVIDGNHIVVNYKMSLRHVGTSRAGDVGGINHYVLNADRKIVKVSVFLDNASLAVVGDLLEEFAKVTRGLEKARVGRYALRGFDAA